MPTLYLVPTPLGDPDDITLRALRILREVSAIAATDQHPAQALMDHYGITTPIIAYDAVLAALKVADVALIAKSGTPGMGDAAHDVVVQAIARGLRVEPLPGASVEITALVLSGLSTEAFVYLGPLPDDLSSYTHERETLIFTTEDLIPALETLRAALGDRAIFAATRLTQPDEIIYRGTASAALAYFRERSVGEFVLVVAGAPPVVEVAWDELRVRAVLRDRLAQGEPLKQVAKEIAAAAGWDRRTVYGLGVEEKGNQP